MEKHFLVKIIIFFSLAILTMAFASLGAYANMNSQPKVQDELSMYKNITVKVDKDGVATLTGTVKTKSEKDDAVARARKVSGVKSVNDKLVVTAGESGSSGMYIDDAGITAQVKGKILAQKGLDSFDISVETVKGAVTLTGEVESSAQVALAEKVARDVEGVKSVNNKLTTKK